MIAEFNPLPGIDAMIANIPKRIKWKNLRKALHDLEFFDAIEHDEQITANLYVTDDAAWNLSPKRSITVHLAFTMNRREILSNGLIVLPNGKRSNTVCFESPKVAIIAALRMHDHLQKTALNDSSRDTPIWEEDE